MTDHLKDSVTTRPFYRTSHSLCAAHVQWRESDWNCGGRTGGSRRLGWGGVWDGASSQKNIWIFHSKWRTVSVNPERIFSPCHLQKKCWIFRLKWWYRGRLRSIFGSIENAIRVMRLVSFLSHDAMLARYMLSSCVCLSVRPSVTRRYCTKTAKHRITQTTLYDSPGTLVLTPKISAKLQRGHPQRGHQIQVGYVQMGDFRQYLAISSWAPSQWA